MATDISSPKFEALIYLNAPRKKAYNDICAYLLDSYRQGHHFRTFNEIYAMLRDRGNSVVQDELHQVLEQLHAWGNVMKRPNYHKARTVEEIRNKSNDYALSETGVTVAAFAENLSRPVPEAKVTDEDIETFLAELKKVQELVDDGTAERFARDWDTLASTFNMLHNGAMRYYSAIGGTDIEERLAAAGEERSREFYYLLRENVESFAGTLHALQPEISRRLTEMGDRWERLEEMLRAAAEYRARLDIDADTEAIYRVYLEQWANMNRYFIPQETGEWGSVGTECQKIFSATINAVTGFFSVFLRRFKEQDTAPALARKYRQLIGWFGAEETDERCRSLMASLYGAQRTRHICLEGGADPLPYRLTEPTWIYNGVGEEPLPLVKRGRKPRQKPAVVKLPSRTEELMHELEVEERRLADEQVEQLLKLGKFALADLPTEVYGRQVRKIIMGWYTTAIQNPGAIADDGRLVPVNLVAPSRYGPKVQLTPRSDRKVKVEYDDGTVTMRDLVVEVIVDER